MSGERASKALELEEIQGLVVNGYASRPVGAYAPFVIEDPAKARRWIAGLADRLQFGEFLRSARDAQPLLAPTCLNLALSHDGLAELGLPETTLGGFHDSFREGMAAPHRSRQLGDDGDSAPEQWIWGGPSTPAVHGVLSGFTGTETENEDDEARLRSAIDSELVAEHGVRLLCYLPAHRALPKEYRREHFGFRDGISNPGIHGLPGKVNRQSAQPPGEFILGYDNIYGKLPLTPRVPVEADPAGVLPHAADTSHLRDFGKNGSYLVFRQLSQDVARFWRFVTEAAAALPEKPSPTWLASRFVGRWPDGTPLSLSPDRDLPGDAIDTNDFRFGPNGDAFGSKCPIGSHIRRNNPRDTMLPLPHDPLVSRFPSATETVEDRVANVNRHRILRRGRLYGKPLDPALDPARMTEDDGQERGLHFLCFNANLRRQFEFVQSTWAIGPGFAGLSRDPDPLLGASRRHPFEANQLTLQGSAECPVRVVGHLPRFVEVRGGAYLFMPSRSALRFIGQMR